MLNSRRKSESLVPTLKRQAGTMDGAIEAAQQSRHRNAVTPAFHGARQTL